MLETLRWFGQGVAPGKEAKDFNVFGHVCKSNDRAESDIQASRGEYEAAAQLCEYAAFWICVQQQCAVEEPYGSATDAAGKYSGNIRVNDEQRHFLMPQCTFEYVLQLIKPALTWRITHS